MDFTCCLVVNKANKVLGLIKRTIGAVKKEIFSTLYKALVRPILEYASPAWCPYLVKDIVLLEKVQRRASPLALGQLRGEMSYEDRSKLLRWSQLTDRRPYFSLIECYKLVFGLNSLCFRDFFEFASKRTRSNHKYKLQVKSANCNCYKYSFFVKIIREWNDLPANVVEVENLRRFKIALKSYMCISKVFLSILKSTYKYIFLSFILEVYSHRVNLLNFLFRVLLVFICL